jgi:hypothetical protein
MRVGFAFFKARHGGVFSKGIALRTGGPYSHVEFYLPTDYVVEEGTGIKRHQCFSSYEGDGGVRWKHINVMGEWWSHLEFEVELQTVKDALEWANSQVGKGYDWAGIMGFVNPWRKGGDPDRWFCSEICRVLAQHLKILGPGGKPADRVSPWDLWGLLASIDQPDIPPDPQSPSGDA